jgi:TonB-linked SusC/RagA family outer membrane protein
MKQLLFGLRAHRVRWHFLPLLLFTMLSARAQEKVPIHGTVRGRNDNVLQGATVRVAGTQLARVTDSLGEFSLTVAPGALLQVSYVGYTPVMIKVKGPGVYNIDLKEKPDTNEVVIIGYGKQKLPTVTGAVSSISGHDLVQTPVSNISNMLVGRTSGISAVQASGEPGQNAATIRIRGIATLNGQDPLIVIDGIQQPAEQPYVILNAMDANEIESISILKDASATAVYGIRGANGVVIITTKRGRQNKPQFSVSANQGFTHATSLFQTLDSYHFALLRNEAIANAQAGGDQSFNALIFTPEELWKFQNNRDYTSDEVNAMANLSPAQKTALINSPALYYTSHNYYQDQFGSTGLQGQYNMNVSGGTSKVRYFTSLGYFQQNGILSNASYGGADNNPTFQRFNFRSNFDIDVARNVQLSVNIGGQSSINKVPGSDANPGDIGNRYQAIIQNILENSPFSGPGIVDGKLVTGFLGTPGASTNPVGLKGGTGYTPLAQLLTGGSATVYTTTLNTAFTLKHTMNYLLKGLDAHFTAAYDDSYNKGFVRINSVPTYGAMRDPSNPANILFVGGQLSPTTTYDNQGNGAWRKIYLEAAINYNHSFGDHNVSALVLGNAQRYTANGQADNTPSGLMGLVGRVTYNYKERYLIEGDLGINGTENFAPANRFGYFPAVSAGWIASKEAWFPKNDVLTWVKFRGSYGEVGNDQIGGRRYLYLPNTWTTGSSGYFFGNSNGSANNPYYSGASESTIGNPNVTWERAKKTNYSADLKFDRNKLSLTGSLFEEKRVDILVTSGIIPANYGVSSSAAPPINSGRVTNKGFELEAGWEDQVGKLSYFIKGNYSYARNKIDYMAEAPYPYPWMDATGYAIGQYKGLLTDGFYNTSEQLANRPYNKFGNQARLGDLRFRDVNGDGAIDDQDEVPIGYPNVPEIAYNLSVGLSYKGFDVSALFIGTAKGSFPQYGYILSTPFAKNVGEVLQSAYDGHWTEQKYQSGQKISYPEISMSGGGPNNAVLSDFWLKSNDFRRLKNMEIGYTFSRGRSFLKRTNIKGVRVYANGNNLVTWGSHLIKGIDPEMADTGKNYMGYLYPLTKTYNVGVNVQF